jgi:uncharacterized membrane protein YtjA (UPF0391 family)
MPEGDQGIEGEGILRGGYYSHRVPPPFVPFPARFLAVFAPQGGRNLCSGLRLVQRKRLRFTRDAKTDQAELVMLSWVVTFLVIALIAGILGFGGIAGVSIEIAKTIFFIAVILFIVSAVVGIARGRTRV